MADGSVSGCTVMDNTDASMPLIDMYRVSVDDVEEDVVTHPRSFMERPAMSKC